MRRSRFVLFLGSAIPLLTIFLTLLWAAPADARYASFLIDADTGEVLHSVDADEQNYPASLTKMMTLFMVFEALQQGRASLNDRLLVSDFAASMAPSKLNLKPGERIRLEDALLGLVTKSANDAAVVIAEALGGTEHNFGRLMTERARKLGMTRTVFANASGLPDPDQLSTARDMATLGIALIKKFPQFYPYFSTRSFAYEGKVHGNHNRLLSTYDGVDGIKTGFIRASGFNLVASAKRDGRRLVGVVFGGQSGQWRDQHMARLLDKGFGKGDHVDRPPTVVANKGAPKNTPRIIATASDPRAQGDIEERRRAGMKMASITQTALAVPAPEKAPTLTPLAGKPAGGKWLVQVGAFNQQDAAAKAARSAMSTAKIDGHVMVSPGPGKGKATVYRARVGGLSEQQARDACKLLGTKKIDCMAMAG